MRPEQMRTGRQAAGLTQQKAAGRLGISQAYLALIESGRRPITARLAASAAQIYGLDPTTLPLDAEHSGRWDSASLAAALARLGYPGFPRRRGGRSWNPAVVILAAIAANELEIRIVEAVPWLIAEYSALDWDWLLRETKLRDLQNRLGFLITLAGQVAKKRKGGEAAERLRQATKALDRARLAREDTLCQESLSEPERRWLRQRRSRQARYWNLLTDLDYHPLPYAG